MFIWLLSSESFSCFFLAVLIVLCSISLTALSNSLLDVIKCRDKSFSLSLVEPSSSVPVFLRELASFFLFSGYCSSDLPLYFPWILQLSVSLLTLPPYPAPCLTDPVAIGSFLFFFTWIILDGSIDACLVLHCSSSH